MSGPGSGADRVVGAMTAQLSGLLSNEQLQAVGHHFGEAVLDDKGECAVVIDPQFLASDDDRVRAVEQIASLVLLRDLSGGFSWKRIR